MSGVSQNHLIYSTTHLVHEFFTINKEIPKEIDLVYMKVILRKERLVREVD